jgi:DNA polymerase-3 subunit gamma/tau
LAEQKRAARDAAFDRVRQEPLVRAVLDRFPGAEIIAVRQPETEAPPEAAIPESAMDEPGDTP